MANDYTRESRLMWCACAPRSRIRDGHSSQSQYIYAVWQKIAFVQRVTRYWHGYCWLPLRFARPSDSATTSSNTRSICYQMRHRARFMARRMEMDGCGCCYRRWWLCVGRTLLNSCWFCGCTNCITFAVRRGTIMSIYLYIAWSIAIVEIAQHWNSCTRTRCYMSMRDRFWQMYKWWCC